jgi:hypothetical protein
VLGAAVGAMTDAVLGNTYDLPRPTSPRSGGAPPTGALPRASATRKCLLPRTLTIRTSSRSKPRARRWAALSVRHGWPADVGFRASASAYTREVLAATFNVHIDDLPNFPFTKADPLIVNRVNPLDPRG